MRPISGFIPAAHGPEDQCGEKGTHGIYLALHGAEPEGVAEAICQRTNGTRAINSNRLADRSYPTSYRAIFFEGALPPTIPRGLRPAALQSGFSSPHSTRKHQTFCKKDDGKVQEKDGEGAQDGVHGVHRHGSMLRFYADGKEARKQLEHRVSRGMSHLQLIGRRNEFSAVPERCGGFYGGKVGDR